METSFFGSLTWAVWVRVGSTRVKGSDLTRDVLTHCNPADCTSPVSAVLLRGCQRADNHLQSPLGHSLNAHVISDPIYLIRKRGNQRTRSAGV